MFDLEHYLSERQSMVDAALDRVLPDVSQMPSVLHEAMRYGVLSGGKRLRPILTMAAAEAWGGDASDALPPGLALEVLHSYTLVHDDLPCMDDDDMRRGRPAAHIQFGEANAILAADALQAFAFGLAGSTPAPPPAVPTAYVIELAEAAAAVVAGQVQDIAAVAGAVTHDELDFIHLNKTAYLFRAACRMGAISASATPEQIANMAEFGAHLGVAFQLIDDLLDASETGDALNEDPSSSVNVLGINEVRTRAKFHTQRAIELLDECDAAVPIRALATHMLGRTV
jgi:geranylgeranyl diphosphate synthase type II